MERLTTNKDVFEMNMVELAHNCCYAKDGNARYRDFDTDIDAREMAMQLLKKYANADEKDFANDEDFDDSIYDCLQYGTDDVVGLIALFYRNLWSMADLRETLECYEDLEEQGRLVKLPCKVGDTVYTNTSVQGWYQRKENRPYKAKIVFIGINGVDSFMNADLGNGHMLQFYFSEIGKTVFLTQEQAEQALKEMEKKINQ